MLDSRRLLLWALLLALLPAGALAQTAINPDTVRAGRLDGGKMWLFEAPPVDYLRDTYGFEPGAAWFERARLGALRMPGCSASFVSAQGLVATNHHCIQSQLVNISREGEQLLDLGFHARSHADERPIPNMYLDQAVAIADVTDEVDARISAAAPQTDAEFLQAQREALEAVQQRILAEVGNDGRHVVQVVPLYQGGRYSAYTFRRYTDVRMVFAPEQRLGFFGGDPDNFTFPRYALDVAFMRVYENGQPFQTPHFFPLSSEGVSPEEVVFVVGNPGSTSRGLTVAQLEFLRDVTVPVTLQGLRARIAVLDAHIATGPTNVDAFRSQRFGLSNSEKAFAGRLDALSNAYIMARRAAAERNFRAQSPEAPALLDRMAALQQERRTMATQTRAFQLLFNPTLGSTLMRRALAFTQAERGDERARASLTALTNRDAAIERGFLTLELEVIKTYLEATDKAVPAFLQGSAQEAADYLIGRSALAQANPTVRYTDPAYELITLFYDDFVQWQQASAGWGAQEQTLARALGRARFGAFGTSIPPDATFSLRFTDGVVRGYAYNGTLAPPFTTFHGMYERHAAFSVGTTTDHDWRLPPRWVAVADRLAKHTPLNFVSTSDTIGGNSGSPAVNRNLELVGINFDRTIEGLSRDYMYWDGRGRNVMVDMRGVQEALHTVYEAHELLAEIRAR